MSRFVQTDTLPTTARSIALLLASTPTIQDAQPGVLHQLLEFSHRYTSQVLYDANVYAEHAGRAGKIEMEDVVLAVQARVGWEFGGRVPKEVYTPQYLISNNLNNALPMLVSTLPCSTNKCNPTPFCIRSIWYSYPPSTPYPHPSGL